MRSASSTQSPASSVTPRVAPISQSPDHETLRACVHSLAARRDITSLPLTHGTALIIPASHLSAEIAPATLLASSAFDHRYYQVVQHALVADFPLHYLLLLDSSGEFRGLHPFFAVRQDILAGTRGRLAGIARRIRRFIPNFLTLKTLMVGNPAGPATLGLRNFNVGPDDTAWTARALSEALQAYARQQRIRVLVFKDFPAGQRHAMKDLTHANNGFGRLPSMPMTRLPISSYSSFDDYLQKTLSKSMRKDLRRKFRDSADQAIHLSVAHDISDCVDEVYGLYLQVFNRARLKFEKLTPEYFLELGRRMPDRVRFFLWRLGGSQGRLIAASVTLIDPGEETGERALYDLYLGMEYPLALDLHLYFLTMRDILAWAIAHRIDAYYSTPLNYDAKLHLRHQLVPQDLYVRHVSPLFNPLFKWAMRFAEPTAHDKILQKFPNAHELKGPS